MLFGVPGGGAEHGGGGEWNFMKQHLEQHGGSMGHFASSLIGGPAGAAIGAGVITYEGFKQAFSVAESESDMRIAGVSDDKIKQADAEAGKFGMYGMSKLQALEAIRMAMGPLNSDPTSSDTGVDAGMGVLPSIAKFDAVARALKGEEGGDATKQVFELFKADELRNKLSPAEAQKFIEDYGNLMRERAARSTRKHFIRASNIRSRKARSLATTL